MAAQSWQCAVRLGTVLSAASYMGHAKLKPCCDYTTNADRRPTTNSVAPGRRVFHVDNTKMQTGRASDRCHQAKQICDQDSEQASVTAASVCEH